MNECESLAAHPVTLGNVNKVVEKSKHPLIHVSVGKVTLKVLHDGRG